MEYDRSNNWSNSSLKALLNEDYYNRTGDFINTGLKDTSKKMISNIIWNIGGVGGNNNPVKEFYKVEREEASLNNYATKWTGKVGLIYPSDYGYATSGNTTTNKETCLTTGLSNSWTNNCINNDWLWENGKAQWTITHDLASSSLAFGVNGNGTSGGNSINKSLYVKPVVYLNLNIEIHDGTGSMDDPYILQFI